MCKVQKNIELKRNVNYMNNFNKIIKKYQTRKIRILICLIPDFRTLKIRRNSGIPEFRNPELDSLGTIMHSI